MNGSKLRSVFVGAVSALALCASGARLVQESSAPADAESKEEELVQVHYLEIVTPEVEATCEALAKVHGVEFGEPVAELGGARTAKLAGGGELGVRAPMRASEEPVVRPYRLVEDIEAAVRAVEAAGAQLAMPPTPIPERGRFAIYVQGGIQHGLWER